MMEILPKIVCIVCIIALFIILVISLVANEHQLNAMTTEAQALGRHVQDQQEIIVAQQDLITLYQEQNASLSSLLGQASDTLLKIVYGPFSREEVQAMVSEVAEIIEGVNEALAPEEIQEISQTIVHSAVAADIDPLLLLSMAITESHCRPGARGRSGEYGMLQVMPGTGEWIASRLGYADWSPEDLWEVKTNVQFSAYYLRIVTREFRDTQQGVLAYNRGSTGARRWMRENAPEDHRYVQRVMGTYDKLRGV